MNFPETREELIALTKEFYQRNQKPQNFVPGETYIPVTAKKVDADDFGSLIDASLDMWLTAGRFSKQFEAEFSSWFGKQPKALLVNSGSSANLLAVSALGSPELHKFGLKPLQAGDEVITLAAGFPTTVAPVVQNGWKPVFIDIDLETLNALPEAIKAARTEKTRAVVLAHTLGNPFRADIVADWCVQENLYLVEDCCDALGASVNNKLVGSFGQFATASFYPAHHITMGEGGAVMASDSRFRRVAESLRDWGRDCWCDPGKDNSCKKRFGWKLGDLPEGYDHKYTYSHLGYNLKVTDMQAALGVSQLKKAAGFIEERRRNWNYLYTNIKNSALLSEYFMPVEPTPETKPSWFGFPMICREDISREKVVSFLEDHKVGTRLLFAGNLTKQPAFKGVNYRIHGELKNTDKVMNKLFWIGVHPALDQQRMDYMIEQLEAFVKQH